MSFELFVSKIEEYCRRSGKSICQLAHEDGRHIARFDDGSVIMGNSVNTSVTWRDEYHNHCIQYSAA